MSPCSRRRRHRRRRPGPLDVALTEEVVNAVSSALLVVAQRGGPCFAKRRLHVANATGEKQAAYLDIHFTT